MDNKEIEKLMKDVQFYTQHGWYWSLLEIAEDEKLPERVRKAAKNSLKDNNSLANDGILTEGTIKPKRSQADHVKSNKLKQ